MRCGGMCRLCRPSRYVLMTRSSEGVQVGSVRSKFGVLGSWTTVLHDRHDPVGKFLFPLASICRCLISKAGPFWLWKTDMDEIGQGLYIQRLRCVLLSMPCIRNY